VGLRVRAERALLLADGASTWLRLARRCRPVATAPLTPADRLAVHLDPPW